MRIFEYDQYGLEAHAMMLMVELVKAELDRDPDGMLSRLGSRLSQQLELPMGSSFEFMWAMTLLPMYFPRQVIENRFFEWIDAQEEFRPVTDEVIGLFLFFIWCNQDGFKTCFKDVAVLRQIRPDERLVEVCMTRSRELIRNDRLDEDEMSAISAYAAALSLVLFTSSDDHLKLAANNTLKAIEAALKNSRRDGLLIDALRRADEYRAQD